MPEQSIANKLELLLSEISAIRNAINSNNHPNWSPSTHNLSDIPNDVESMFAGHAGLYQDAANHTAYVSLPVIPDYAFNKWGNALTEINLSQSITSIGDYGCNATNITWTQLPSTLTNIGDYALASTLINISTLPPALIHLGNYPFKNSNTRSITGALPSTLTYIGDGAFYFTDYALANFSGNIPQHLTYIGGWAFYKCVNTTLTGNLVDPNDESDTPIIVGEYAFCCDPSNIETIDTKLTIGGDTKGRLQPGTAAFRGRTNITFSGLFPKKYYDYGDITYVPEYVFCNCYNIEFTQTNMNVGSIGRYAFYKCGKINVTGSITASGSINQYAFYGCSSMIVSDDITVTGIIRFEAFWYCSSMVVANKIESSSIGDFAFTGCTSLECNNGIYVNGDYIGESAFEHDSSLAASIIKITGKTAHIKHAAFRDSGFSVQSLLIDLNGSNNSYIDGNAFFGCNFVNTDVTIKWTDTSGTGKYLYFGSGSNCAQIFTGDLSGNYGVKSLTFIGNIPTIRGFSVLDKLTSITFSSSTTILTTADGTDSSDGCFENCGLTSITIPYTLTTLGARSFMHCRRLESVTFTEYTDENNITHGTETIGKYCFGSWNLANRVPLRGTVILPSSLKTLDEFAFRFCNLVTEWYFRGTPTSIHEDAFADCTGTIYVPWNQGDIANFPGNYTGNVVYNYSPT